MSLTNRRHWQVQSVLDAFRALSVSKSPTLPLHSQTRSASHAAQTSVNSKKNGPGKRLGAKKTGGQRVLPSQIIFRQRGTKWFPGENCGMGRDHTIFAKEEGYVRYYKDPQLHPERQYIGVVFEQSMQLPVPKDLPRRRRLGLEAVEMTPAPSEHSDQLEVPGIPGPASASKSLFLVPNPSKKGAPIKVHLRPGYMYREGNWEIGRTAERLNVKGVNFVPGDRFKAWRKRSARRKRAIEHQRSSQAKQKRKKRS